MTLLEDLRSVTRPGGLNEVSLEHTERLVALCVRAADEIEYGPVHHDWQPISTAPKDGSLILVTDGDLYAMQYWDTSCPVHSWCCAMAGEIVFAQDYDGTEAVSIDPTHWMRLPALPRAKAPAKAS